MSKWGDEETWLAAREGGLREIQMWERSPWVRTGGRTYSGADKDEYIAKKLKGRLARIEAAGEQSWMDRLHAKPDPKSWLSPADEMQPRSKGQTENVPLFVVPPETKGDAIDLLKDAQFIELTIQQFDHLSAGKAALQRPSADARPYLVRGVSPNSAGACSAYQEDGVLTVFCGSVREWRYEFRPVITFLGEKPSRVWIGAFTALSR